MNTNEHLDEIRARADNATEGPWTNRKQRETEKGPDARWIYPGNIVVADSHQIIVTQTGNAANSRFIAHAREDVPYLLAIVARVQALLEQYEADDREHLNTFGQHHPYAGWAADHLREALTGEA